MRYTIVALASLLTTLHALTITSPTAGSIVDPSQPIVIQWTSTPSDPATINLVLVNSADSTFAVNGNNNQVGANVPTASGTYTIPANTFAQFGSGYTIRAQSANGDTLAVSNSFILGYGANQVVTLSNGQLSLAPTPTGGAQQTSLSSLSFDTSGLDGQSVTASYLPSSSYSTSFSNGTPINPTATGNTSLSSLVFTTDGVTGSMTIMTSSSARSASSSSSSSVSTARSTSSSPAAATVNAQPKVGAGREVMGVAGLLAGLVALIV